MTAAAPLTESWVGPLGVVRAWLELDPAERQSELAYDGMIAECIELLCREVEGRGESSDRALVDALASLHHLSWKGPALARLAPVPPQPETAALDALSKGEQAKAIALAERTASELRAQGYDFVLVRLAKVVSEGDESAVPGGLSFKAAPSILPAFPREADLLRGMAEELDFEFAKSGAVEAEQGYVEDVTPRRGPSGEEPS